MKKLIIGLLVLGLIVVGVLGFTNSDLLTKTDKTPAPAETTDAAAEPAQEAESPEAQSQEEAPAEAGGVDYDAIYALHDPEEVVMTIDGKDVTWQDYFYAYYSQASGMEQNFEMYQNYGMAMGWDSQADEEGHTFADLVGDSAEKTLGSLIAVERMAEDKGVTLNEEEEAALEAEHKDNIAYFCGEDGSEEELYEQLKSMYLPRDLYWRVIRHSYIAQALLRSEGEKLSDEEVLSWMEENGILSANHILIGTMNLSTGEALDEATVAEKTALAQQIAQELQAIEDPAEREKRFLELKEQYCEDGGDYVFGPGVMVEEFYNGTQALEEGAVSDPIQSTYGYHIILRRPLHADDTVMGASGTQSARDLIMSESMSQQLQERMESQTVEYAPGFEVPYVLDYYTKPSYAE